MPKTIQITASREDLPRLYREVLDQNPLLARIEAECRTVNWADEEIRTIQLLAACRSNASLTERLQQLEHALRRQRR